ncbi:MAG: FAD binding domain-containing protein [Chloroflexota bacterium]|nr:FAD binding domain-containing protein [Chloroflexota bacterium]
MWQSYFQPTTLQEALATLASHGDKARIIAGGTDLILELERGVRGQPVLIDITRVAGLDAIEFKPSDGEIFLGPQVTHNDVAASSLLVARAFPLARACWEVGAPQIRNRGTVAGNLITASPANDTITPLWALDGSVTLSSQQRGDRRLSFDQFFLGVRKTAMEADEMLTGIHLRALSDPGTSGVRRGDTVCRGTFIKLGLRSAQAIAVVNVAVVIDFEDDLVTAARITLGSVAPTIVRATDAEASLVGKPLSNTTIFRASELAAGAAQPIDDLRGSAEYRRSMVGVLTERALNQLREGRERDGWPRNPVFLSSGGGIRQSKYGQPSQSGDGGMHPETGNEQAVVANDSALEMVLNGRPVELTGARGKTLLRVLRENAGLTGVKEGCAEGECGACTVWLDGEAVMACLVAAERAQGCQVVTVEGLARGDDLHAIQDAFVSEGGVQCGYCTPGLIMSGAKLLEERPQPSLQDIQQALAGNLCRCTGYTKVVAAILAAANR